MARRLIPKSDGKGYTQESRQSSVTRTSNETFLTMMAKNEQEKNRYKSTIGHITKDGNHAKMISRRDLDVVREDYAKMRAYAEVYELHRFERYDPLKGRSRGAESNKKGKVGGSKLKLSLPDLMFKALQTRGSKNMGNDFQTKPIYQNSAISRGVVINKSNIAESTDGRYNTAQCFAKSDHTPQIVAPKPTIRDRSSQDRLREFRMRHLMPNMNKTEFESKTARRRRTRETKIWINSNPPENILPPPVPQSKHKVVIVCHDDLVKEKNNPNLTSSAKEPGPLQTIKEESFVATERGSKLKYDKNALPVAEKTEIMTVNTTLGNINDVDNGECGEISNVTTEEKTQEVKLSEVKASENMALSTLPPLPRQHEETLSSLGDNDQNSVWRLTLGLPSLMLWKKTVTDQRQTREKPKSEPPRASWRKALEKKNRPKSLLPGECTTAYALKKYMQREITSVMDAWSPTNKRQVMIEEIRGKNRTLSAGYGHLNNTVNRDLFSRNSASKESAISDISGDTFSTLKTEKGINSPSEFMFLKDHTERKAWTDFLGKVRKENMTKKKAFFPAPEPNRLVKRSGIFHLY